VNNPKILISGATGFLGKGLSNHFAGLGFDLAILGRDEAKLKILSSNIEKEYKDINCEFIVCDLNSEYEITKALENLNDIKIHHYINCVAIQGKPTITASDLDLRELDLLMNVNLYSAIIFSKYFVERWADDQFHSIVHTSGGGAANSRPEFNSYSLTKTALVRFVENFSQMVGNKKIIVNAVAPGAMPSSLLKQVLDYPELSGTREQENALRAINSEQSLDPAVLNLFEFLVRDSSSYLTGRLISAKWDDWHKWHDMRDVFLDQNVYRIRRKIPSESETEKSNPT